MDTWGDLPKSQVDSQSIADAIDDKIIAHLDDPDAHIESGQSLQSHKASAIIDHVLGSVLADKMTHTEMLATTIFESLDGWEVVGNVDNSVFPGVKLTTEYPYTLESSLKSNPQVPSNFLSSDYDMLFQTMLRSDDTLETLNAWFGYLEGYGSSESFYGFQIREGALYCHYNEGTESYDYECVGVNLALDHIYRVQYNSSDRLIAWYIDGALFASYTIGESAYWGTDFGPSVGVVITEETETSLVVGYITFSRQV